MNTLTKSTVISLAVGLLAVTGIVYASPAEQWPSFEQVDKNRDGAIEKNEAKLVKDLDFKAADVNRDGKISQKEYQTAMFQQLRNRGMSGG